MLNFPRSAARRLRNAARRCLAGRPRGPAPPVWIVPASRGLRLTVAFDEIILSLSVPGDVRPEAPMVLPMEALDAVEGPGEDPVQVEPPPESVTLHWSDRGLPRSRSFPAPVTGGPPPRLTAPRPMVAVPAGFLKAMHEAGRCASREPQRYALHRVQIRGAAGEILGTDARFVVRFEGFTLPFEDEILVPAVSCFGTDEFAKPDDVRLGRTAKSLVIAAGGLEVRLRIDRDGRYPDVAGVIPRDPDPTVVTFDPAEALFLLDALPDLPGHEEADRPVTLDLQSGQCLSVRAADRHGKNPVEVRLPHSTVTSGPQRLALDRRHLIRLLALGGRTLRVFGEERPVVAAGESVTMLVMPVEITHLAPPGPSARVLTPGPSSDPLVTRSHPMKTAEPSVNGSPESEPVDPLAEAEALRGALNDAQQRLGRLTASLRSRRKEQKALTQVWSSIKNLQLGD